MHTKKVPIISHSIFIPRLPPKYKQKRIKKFALGNAIFCSRNSSRWRNRNNKYSALHIRAQKQSSGGVLRNFVHRRATLLKKSPWHRCFPVNFTKFLRTPSVAASVSIILDIRLTFEEQLKVITAKMNEKL